MGPAMRVVLRGSAGWRASAMTATAASDGGAGWHTATRAAGSHRVEEPDDVVEEIVEAEWTCEAGTSRALVQSVM